jgi:hypothetical protein
MSNSLLIDFDIEKCVLISFPLRRDMNEFNSILNKIKEGDNDKAHLDSMAEP